MRDPPLLRAVFPFTPFPSHQKTFVMLIELKVQRRVQPRVLCAPMRARAGAQVRTITSNVLIRARRSVRGACALTIIPRRCERLYSYKRIQTPPARQQSNAAASIGGFTCLFISPSIPSFCHLFVHRSPFICYL